jgi:hypothetical protein
MSPSAISPRFVATSIVLLLWIAYLAWVCLNL